jgi:CRISPR/Cas system-associated protein endoribonuclease Cas2
MWHVWAISHVEPAGKNDQEDAQTHRSGEIVDEMGKIRALQLLEVERHDMAYRAPTKQGNQNENNNKQTVVHNTSFHFD